MSKGTTLNNLFCFRFSVLKYVNLNESSNTITNANGVYGIVNSPLGRTLVGTTLLYREEGGAQQWYEYMHVDD